VAQSSAAVADSMRRPVRGRAAIIGTCGRISALPGRRAGSLLCAAAGGSFQSGCQSPSPVYRPPPKFSSRPAPSRSEGNSSANKMFGWATFATAGGGTSCLPWVHPHGFAGSSFFRFWPQTLHTQRRSRQRKQTFRLLLRGCTQSSQRAQEHTSLPPWPPIGERLPCREGGCDAIT
jgi:hypothetical protein